MSRLRSLAAFRRRPSTYLPACLPGRQQASSAPTAGWAGADRRATGSSRFLSARRCGPSTLGSPTTWRHLFATQSSAPVPPPPQPPPANGWPGNARAPATGARGPGQNHQFSPAQRRRILQHLLSASAANCHHTRGYQTADRRASGRRFSWREMASGEAADSLETNPCK